MIGIHSQCRFFQLHEISESFLATTHYTFQPSSREEKRRAERTEKLLANKLQGTITSDSFPLELWLMVASYLTRECAVITGQEQALKRSSTQDDIIDIQGFMFASYVIFDGVQYVKTLRSSTRTDAAEGERLLQDSRKTSVIKKVYIAEDHLGIRMVLFRSPDSFLSDSCASQGLWWRAISGVRQATKFNVKSDVGKCLPVRRCN